MQKRRTDLTAYLQRSFNYVSRVSTGLLTSDLAWKREMPLFTFKTRDYLQQWKVGCDADIGIQKKLMIDFKADFLKRSGASHQQAQLCYGETCRLKSPLNRKCVSPDMLVSDHSYSILHKYLQKKERPYTLFHKPAFDVTQFRYIAIRAKGDSKQWFVNIQSESVYPHYLWQHRMRFKTPGEWETILV